MPFMFPLKKPWRGRYTETYNCPMRPLNRYLFSYSTIFYANTLLKEQTKINCWNKFLCIQLVIISSMQGFIQALLLTSVFLEGLSFMAIGHNPAYISMLCFATGGSSSWRLWLFQELQVFTFPCIIRGSNLSLF